MASTLTVDNIVGATTAANVKTPAGTVLQTQVNKYDTEVTTTSSTFAATGASVTITPKFATSHILVGIQGTVYMIGNSITTEPKVGFKLYRSEGGGSDVEIRSFLPSSIAPRLTRPETTGASLTGANEKDWLAFMVPPFESETK